MSSATAAVAASLPRYRGPRLTLYRYVAREILRPMAFALLGLTAIVLTTRVLEFSELVINRGVEPATVAAILFYEAVPVAARMLPFAVLVASLFALGRMGADREVLALASLGQNPARLAWPIVSFAGVGALVALAAAVWATPWASRSLDAQLAAISREKPWANLRAGAVQRFGGWQLEALEVSPSGDAMRSVMLWTPDIGQTLFAERGRLAAAGGEVDIVLEHGAVVLARDGGVQHVRFDELETRLPAGDVLERKERERILGLPLDELALRDAEFVPTEFMRLSSAGIELQRRFAYPFATLVFGFLAVPLFLTRSHASRSAGAVMGLACTLAYYGLVQLSEGLMQAGRVGIALGAWLPNLLLSALAAVLLVRALRERALGKGFDRRRGGRDGARAERDARSGHEPRRRATSPGASCRCSRSRSRCSSPPIC
jgi:lipopolysaccharide export LptBFGC system permease protein LptF